MPEEINSQENGIEPPTDNRVKDTLKPYQDNLEYIADHFERIKLLKDIQRFRQNEKSRSATEKKQKEDELKSLEQRIMERLRLSTRTFPLEEFRRKKSLSKTEELVVTALLEKEVSRSGHFHIEELLDLISSTQYEKLLNRKLFHEDGRLIKDRVIETGLQPLRNGIIEYAKLNENLRRKLLGEKKRRKRTSFKGDDLFEVIKPSIPLDKVILHPKTFEDVGLAIEMSQGKTSRTLREWGIHGDTLSSTSTRKMKNPSVVMLFYGPPGTGKTLSADAIAYTLQRKLLTLDCSKILGSWVGESEQNTRKIFDTYKERSKSLRRPPILLLNEADQFLHRRINADRSVENMYNQMQNIFLEQIERFEGILIATTNLIENLDPAFSRRFHFKIEFRRPEKEERFKLWTLHLPPKTPLSENVDLKLIADNYDLSGGQISTIILNAATRAARRGDSINQEDFIEAIETELNGNFDEKAKGCIGFRESAPYKNRV